MLGVNFRFTNRQASADGRGYAYDAWYEDTVRGKSEWLARIEPYYIGDRRMWAVAHRSSLGPHKTRREAASAALADVVLDPETQRLRSAVNLRTQHTIDVTEELATAIWDILVEEHAANDKGWERQAFVREFTHHDSGEYHLHAWIPGGKVFWNRQSIWVHGYPESRTPLSRNMEARVNHRIQRLLRSTASR